MKEPKPMREIHEIRERLYEEEKNLSMAERLKRTHEAAERFMRKSKRFRKKTQKVA